MRITKLDHTGKRMSGRPRCKQHITSGVLTADSSKYDLTRCKMTAMYDVNGELLCERHAGMKLIQHHLRKQVVEE